MEDPHQKPIKETLEATLGRLANMPTPIQPPKPPQQLQESRLDERPRIDLATHWQRKWLGLSAWHPKVQEAATATEQWCNRAFHNQRRQPLLVLAGPTGIGKTHSLMGAWRFINAVTFQMYESGDWIKLLDEGTVSVERVLWSRMADEIKAQGLNMFEALMSADIAFIDDIGAEHDPWGEVTAKLCQILSRREDKFTMITTNYGPLDWGKKFDARIEDRLLRGSDVVDLSGVESWSKL